MRNSWTLKRSRPYCTNTQFKYFDIRALWHSGLSATVPECQKFKNVGLDQYGTKRFGRLIFATIRKNGGNERIIKSALFVEVYITRSRAIQRF